MKKFILNISILIIPIVLLLIIVNYVGDSANLFKTGYEFKMAKILIADSFVTNIANYDDRIFQKEVIVQLKKAPEIIVLGASKTMLIDGPMLGSNNIFNNSVSVAVLKDYIAIYQIYKENNILPKKVIIDIEPYLFNKNNQHQHGWKSIRNFYYDFNNERRKGYDFLKYKELISLSYFQVSLENFSRASRGNDEPLATKNKFNKTATKLTDGTVVYSKSYRDVSQNEIDEKASSYLAGGSFSIDMLRFNSIDKYIWTEFEKLINDMKMNNIIVEFFLCPHHPKVYNTIKDECAMALATEEMIIKYAREHNIRLYGSYSPYNCGVNETDFFDGVHLQKKGVRKVFAPNE